MAKLTVTATAADAAASIRVRANAGEWQAASSGSSSPALSLDSGTDSAEIEVTAEDLDTTTYSVKVQRVTPGSVDATFDTGSVWTPVVSGGMWPLALQPDDKVLVGGSFWLNYSLPSIVARVWGD